MMPDRWFQFVDLTWPPGSDPYLYRWTLAVLGRGSRCYLHRYLGSDWARDLHDHPKVFWSIGLWGGYVEQTPAGIRQWRAPWISAGSRLEGPAGVGILVAGPVDRVEAVYFRGGKMMTKSLGAKQLEFLGAYRLATTVRFTPTRTGRPGAAMQSLTRRDLIWIERRQVAHWRRLGRSKRGVLVFRADGEGPIGREPRALARMTAYYNEIDPFGAAWLRNLITAGHIMAARLFAQ